MTKQQFIDKAVRAAERHIYAPRGWWGTRHDLTNGRVRVSWSSSRGGWRITLDGKEVSRHDSRTHAIRKAAKL